MIRINLLPVKALQAEVARRRETIIGGVVLGAVILLLIASYVYQNHELSRLQNELTSLRAELQALNVKVKEVGDLQNKIKDLRSKNKIIENLNKKKSGPVLVMESLSTATPNSVWLTDLRETGGSVTMNGLAADNQSVADFMKAIASSKFFKNVELVESTQARGRRGSPQDILHKPPQRPPARRAAAARGGKKPGPRARQDRGEKGVNQL